MTDLVPHELALLIPPMGDDDYAALRDSIAAQGLLYAITLHEGKILDGIHRQRAVDELGLDARYQPFKGDDPLGYVIAANISRRQLNTTERAKIGALIAVRMPSRSGGDRRSSTYKYVADRNGSVAAAVARTVGVGEASVVNALFVLRTDPSVFDQMDGRALKLGTATRRLAPQRHKRRKPDDPRTDAEKRAERHTHDVKAWKRVIAVDGAAERMWIERAEVLGAIERARDPGAVAALAGQVGRAIWQLRTVLDACAERMSETECNRTRALMLAQGWPVNGEVIA